MGLRLSEYVDEIWDRVYNMDGFGIQDYVKEFYGVDLKSSQHGDYVYVLENGVVVFSWDEWSKYCENASHYFDTFMNAVEQELPKLFQDEEQIVAVIVYQVLQSCGFAKDLPAKTNLPPFGHDKFHWY